MDDAKDPELLGGFVVCFGLSFHRSICDALPAAMLRCIVTSLFNHIQ